MEALFERMNELSHFCCLPVVSFQTAPYPTANMLTRPPQEAADGAEAASSRSLSGRLESPFKNDKKSDREEP